MKSWVSPAVKGLTGIGLLVAVARDLDIRQMGALLAEASPQLFAAATCVMLVQALFAAKRWHQVLHHQRCGLSFRNALRYFWLGLFFNQVLPTSMGGDAVRGYHLFRDGLTVGDAARVVLLDRIGGLVGLVLIVIVTLPMSAGFITEDATRWGVFLVVGGAVTALTGIFAFDWVARWLPQWRLVRSLAALSAAARCMLLAVQPGIRLVSLAIIVHVLSVVAMAVLSLAINVEVNWKALIIVVPLAMLLMAVPVSIAGWGVREGVMVVGLSYAGLAAEQAMMLSILFGLAALLVALPGGIVWLLHRRHQWERVGST